MTEKRHVRVFILAQGQQRRLPNLTVPKQMLRLPACGNQAIIDRTLCQLAMILPNVNYAPHGETVDTSWSDITVVCEGMLAGHIELAGQRVRDLTNGALYIDRQTLPAPGNSSLKGIQRAFAETLFWNRVRRPIDQTIVLLGDVVYSWECLEKIIAAPLYREGEVRFVGSSDLDPGNGELWGLSWCWSQAAMMATTLESALTKHPPFVDYQPGQMRRWLWEVDRARGIPQGASFRGRKRSWFQACDDYTRDIDIPKHVELLCELGELAAADDREHHLVWKDPS